MQLVFDHVSKFFGQVAGLNDVTCTVDAGITALLGSNGAGKSTMLKLASGQLRPSAGSVRIGADSAWSTAAKRQLGYSPDANRFYEDLSGREFVYTMARLHGYARAEARERTEQALQTVEMDDRADRRLAGCSLGMRQRVKLAQALLHDPAVLVLDEPLNGIDPAGRWELKELFRRLADQGKSLLISTHQLGELDDLAERILYIARGRLLASGTVSEIRNLMDDRPLTVEIAADPPRRLAALLVAFPEVQSVEMHGPMLRIRTTHPQEFFQAVERAVLQEGVRISRMEVIDAGTEAVFHYLQQVSW